MKTANQLTTKQLLLVFGVSHMTVYSWRNLEHDPLPVVAGTPPRTVLFCLKEVKAWAKRNGVQIMVEPSVVLEQAKSESEVKPGPKKKEPVTAKSLATEKSKQEREHLKNLAERKARKSAARKTRGPHVGAVRKTRSDAGTKVSA